jgi:hypothetical protein
MNNNVILVSNLIKKPAYLTAGQLDLLLPTYFRLQQVYRRISFSHSSTLNPQVVH